MQQSIILLPGEQIPMAFHNEQTLINRDSININLQKMQLESKKGGVFEIQQKTGKQKSQYEQEIKINHTHEKYYPQLEEFVIGIIKSKTNDFYTVNIGSPQEAILGALDFEGASKKNKPNLEVGQLIYCRVTSINKYLRPKVSCINPKSKKEWVTGETLFGPLKNGVQFQICMEKCKNMKDLDYILKQLQKYLQFEVAIGKNGRVWIKCAKEANTVFFINTLKSALNLSYEQIPEFISGISHLFQK